MQTFKFGNLKSVLSHTILGLNTAALLLALGMYAYLGVFTRYMSDDYCETVQVRSETSINAVIDRYLAGQWRAADRYSNLLFVGLSEAFGPGNLQIGPVIMILLWIVALTWSVYEIRKLAGFQWPALVDCFLAALVAFLAILQAPNRFQTFYRRSSMATHFAPLVFLFLLIGFILFHVRNSKDRQPALWVFLIVFLGAFVIGGFSEPPTAVMVVGFGLALAGVWRWGRGPGRRAALLLLAWALTGAVLALVVMFFAPAHFMEDVRIRPDLITLALRTLKYTFEFILDSLKTLPLPTVVSILVPGFFFFRLFVNREDETHATERLRRLRVPAALTLLSMYILIAASFAPSVYGQSYPVERARFLGRLVMTTALVFEGALAGVLVARSVIRSKWRSLFYSLASLAFLLSALYPLRAAWQTLSVEVPEYRTWTAAWDVRDAQIRADRAEGMQDLIVVQLPGFHNTKELDANPDHWVNRCAADFYDLHSISSTPPQENSQ